MRAGSPSYSITVRAKLPNRPGSFARVAEAIGKAGGVLGPIDLISVDQDVKVRDIVVYTNSEEHEQAVLQAVQGVPDVEVLHMLDRTTQVHIGGKLSVESRYPLRNHEDLSMLYTPGVARISKMVENNPDEARRLTVIGNMVAVVSDGTAVLGLGDIGPVGALPVMEGKAVLFKVFGKVDAFPICVDTKDVDEIIETVVRIAPVFGGINLEDIAAPRCFDIEEGLIERLEIPIFHDDQHGTAVVVGAALTNALKIVGKKPQDIKIAMAGVGAAGTAVSTLLLEMGVKELYCCGRKGILHPDDLRDAHPKRLWLGEVTNPKRIRGSLADAMKGADLFIGLSAPNIAGEEEVKSMAPDAIVFAMSNPVPEIPPEIAHKHARIVATGRSDYRNQINNVLCFPGLFRGLLDSRARRVTMQMKLAAAHAIAGVLDQDHLSEEAIIPSVFDERVAPAVAKAVAATAQAS
jgi:malate dehydrogenase (oxaloacetate-decarboxylating)